MLGADDYQQGGEEPEEWATYGLLGFGAYAPYYDERYGSAMLPAESVMGALHAEIDPSVYNGLARTPLIELSPKDYDYMRVTHQPYDGMWGLGDDGQIYQYSGLHGFFKRMFKKMKKKIKKVARRIRKVARKIIKRLPGGKMLIKIGGKIRKIAMKVIKPMTKFIGKYAAKLAPIARFIPGYGPAIAAGLRVAGKVARVSRRFMGQEDYSQMEPPRQYYGGTLGNPNTIRETLRRMYH